MSRSPAVAFRSDLVTVPVVALATARAYLQRVSAYLIQLIRWPLGPIFMFASWRVLYGVSGRGHVGGATLSGFLLIGVFGLIIWSSSIWASGYAIEFERQEGTSGSLFLTPASRAGVVAGYGLGSFVWFLPGFVAVGILGVLTGARFHVSDPLSVLVAGGTLIVASLAAGFTFSGIFILSRRGNLIANVVQSPLYLLSGLMVPLSSLPPWLLPASNAIPVTHAIVALRASTLLGAGMGTTWREAALSLVASMIWFLAGLAGLRRVENVARRTGQLDLY